MDEIKEMLKAVINGQHALRAEMIDKIFSLEHKMEKGFAEGDKRFAEVDTRFVEVNERLDRQGKQLAYLEEDAPTREEHNILEKRVEKIERQIKN